MVYSRRRVVITLLSAVSCFQLAGGTERVDIDNSAKNAHKIKRQRGLSDIRTITTIDGCESNKYGIWLYAGSGHINLIGEPITDNKEDAVPSSNNGDDEDPNNGGISSGADNTASCPTLVFDDGGDDLDKAMIDISIVILEQEGSSNGEQQDSTSASNEDHAALWKEGAMRLHKTNYTNANKTASSFVLSEVIAAYDRAMHRIGEYDIFNNNCATFILNMMAQLGIKVDDRMIKFAASELYKNHTVIEPVLQNQTFMEDLFLEFDDGATTSTSSHKTTKNGLLRSSNSYQQAQVTSGNIAAVDSLKGTELFVTYYVNEWRAKYKQMRKTTRTPPPPMSRLNTRKQKAGGSP